VTEGSSFSRPRLVGSLEAMSIIAFIILLAVLGLVVGGLGRLLLPGPDPMTIVQTIMVGIVASYAAGLFSWYVLDRRGAGLILSALFAVLIVWLIRRYRQSEWSRPGPPGPRRP
jgi:uncharacterized membrane protein YeaQ/YmgE (transglycosylase-associated protein family)